EDPTRVDVAERELDDIAAEVGRNALQALDHPLTSLGVNLPEALPATSESLALERAHPNSFPSVRPDLRAAQNLAAVVPAHPRRRVDPRYSIRGSEPILRSLSQC